MAELGQIIVNRVKPLLDTANNAGYETGYGNGFDSGYVSGEASVREYVDTQVEISKKAIIGRGGDISSDAGLEDLPQAIFNIPADASLAHYTDGDIAYRKSVPVGAEKYALLKSVGGMTYKSNNLLPYPYYIMGDKGNIMNGTVNGVSFSITNDGAITLSGTSTSSEVSNIVLINSLAPITFEAGTYTFRQYRSNNDANAYMVWAAREEGANTQYLAPDTVKTFSKKFTLWCTVQIKAGATVNTVLKPMFYKGTATLPHELFFKGLRDSKAVEVNSYRANGELIVTCPIPQIIQALEGWGKGLRSASGNLTTQRDFYNTYDFSTKQYTQWVSETITIDGENVKAVELGSTTGEIRIDLRRPTGAYADYTALQLTRFTPSLGKTPNTAYLTAQGSSLRLNLFTTETFATVEEANEWLKANSIEMIYAFKEPVITDISDILTDDNFIEVESGGSLEFVNEYKNAVPSTLKYTIKVGS